MHDWTKVDPSIFHAFHHGWISALSDWMNAGHLPGDYYSLAEQIASDGGSDRRTVTYLNRFVAETATEFYRRKKSSVVVRHVSGDRMVAVLEIVSPGNKSTREAFRAFVNKACELLELRVHLLLVDSFPPTKRDPEGIHAGIWGEVTDEQFAPPADKPLTLVAYETGLVTRAYIEPFAVGDVLPSMPLYLEPNVYVPVPLEETYQIAFAAMPQRWRRVLDANAE